MVRLATQTAPDHDPWLKQLLKAVPRLTNESRFGVLISLLPNAAIVVGAWSSLMMKRKFGFSAPLMEMDRMKRRRVRTCFIFTTGRVRNGVYHGFQEKRILLRMESPSR